MLSSMLPAYASTTYTLENNNLEVSQDVVKGKSTVLIKKGRKQDSTNANNIVYVDQASTPFEAATNFCIKETADDGIYTIMMGGDNGQVVTDIFYIGMNNAAGDVKMTRREVQDDEKTPETEHLRYLCRVSGNRKFKTVIMKIGEDNFAFPLEGDGWSINTEEGSSVVFGIEIIGNDVSNIKEVWLSERIFDDTDNELKNKEASES